MWACIRQNLLLCASVGLQRRGEERTIAPLSRLSSHSRFHDPTTPTAVGLAPWRDPRGLGLGRRPRQFPALPRPGSPERRRLVHDPLLLGAAAARHPDRLGRVGNGALRRPQGIPFCARNHGRGRQGLDCALSRRDRRADPARRLLLLHPDRELVPRVCVGLLREGWHCDRCSKADRGADQDRERPLRLVHGRQLRRRHARRQAARVRRVLGDRLRDQRVAGLPRHQQGHREVLQLGDAADGGVRARRARSRADARLSGCGASGAERVERPRPDVEPVVRDAEQSADVARGGRTDLLQPLGRLRRDHQLRQLHEEEGRRHRLRPHCVGDQ